MTNEEFIKSVSLEGEEWHDVVGYEGLYSVSNMGRVVSFSRAFRNGKNKKGTCTTKHRIMTPTKSKSHYGYYLRLFLHKNGRRKIAYIHRLIALHYIPNPNNYTEIDHVDGDPSNNSISNLRWCNRKMNMANTIARQRQSEVRKGRPALNRKPIVRLDAKNQATYYEFIGEVVNEGFDRGSIINCLNGKHEIYRGYRWFTLSDYETLISKSKNSCLSQ